MALSKVQNYKLSSQKQVVGALWQGEKQKGEPLRKNTRDVLGKKTPWRTLRQQVTESQHSRRGKEKQMSFKYVTKAHSQKWKLNYNELECSPPQQPKQKSLRATIRNSVGKGTLRTAGENQLGPPPGGHSLSKAQAHIAFDLIITILGICPKDILSE